MNFPLVLLALLVVTGGVWLFDYLVLRHRRTPDSIEPWWIEYPKSFSPLF